MNNENQNQFISRIRWAIINAPSPNRRDKSTLFGNPPDDTDVRLSAYINKPDAFQQQLLQTLMIQAAPINLQVIPVKNTAGAIAAIEALVLEKNPEWGSEKKVTAWRHPLIDKLNLHKVLPPKGVEFFVAEFENSPPAPGEKNRIRNQIIDSYMGITAADFCIAQTATLVMKTRPGQARSVSLVPSIHVAVIKIDQLVENLSELYYRLKWDAKQKKEGLTNCMTFISGPSKTADIEVVMVHGAHGPRELYLYVITG